MVGKRVLDAIRSKAFYAFVGAVPADVIRAHYRRIFPVSEICAS